MYDVTSPKIVDVSYMTPLLRTVLGDRLIGVSSGPTGSRIHLTTDDADVKAIADAAFAGYWSLSLQADKVAIRADGTDTATVTCNDPQLAGLQRVNVHVTFEGIVYYEGQVELQDGLVALELASDLPGRYVIVIWSDVAYNSGAIVIEANDEDYE